MSKSNPKILKRSSDEVFNRARFEDLAEHFRGPLKKKGSNKACTCLYCGKKDSMQINPSKQIMKCFSCGEHFKTPIHYFMKERGVDYDEAIKGVADFYNIILEYTEETVVVKKGVKRDNVFRFREEQLKSSGLTNEDQKDHVVIDETMIKDQDLYESGSLNEKFQKVAGDDMIMRYIDLEGKPMKFTRKGQSKEFELIRVRWQHPHLHLDKYGRPIKYQSPPGSGTHVWINKWIRAAYKNRQKIKTLYIQEGEKKADKASKHGILSVGIMGIWNIANNKTLPKEFELIIKFCKVEEVVFVVDADFNDLSKHESEPVDQRSRTFLGAVQNFRDYFFALNNSGINLKIYFAYVKKQVAPNGDLLENQSKGIDDLLVNNLSGKEEVLLDDFNSAKNDRHGRGQYIDCHDITGHNYYKLSELFHLHNKTEFARFHYAELSKRERFLIGREQWKFVSTEDGSWELQLAQPLGEDEQYWIEHRTKEDAQGRSDIYYKYHYVNAKRFLFNRGFFRYASQDGEFTFINIKDSIVREVKPYEIKDFMIKFTEEFENTKLSNFMLQGSKAYLGPEQLSNLDYYNPHFQTADKGVQFLYFSENYWKITAEGIYEDPLKNLDGHVWKNKIRDFNAKKLSDPLITVNFSEDKHHPVKGNRKKGDYFFEINPEGQKCHFLKYLWNTSNFYWQKDETGLDESKLSPLELKEIRLSFLAKITALGYLLHTYRDPNVAKAIIAMDGKISEVGTSNGRSGKTLFGDAVSEVVPTVTISGKQKDMAEDKFLFEEVNESTAVVYVDDVRVNFDFEHWFPMITGQMKIEAKGIRRHTPPKEKTPKLLITTNHAINGDSGSFKDRQFLLAFSDWYHCTTTSERRPLDDFGVYFFVEWDYEQRNLFYNFMANCIQIYLKHGLIAAPIERLEKRRLRQQISEDMLAWAESYYSISNNWNIQIPKKELYDNFINEYPNAKKYIQIRDFKKKLKYYCLYKGWEMNPGKEHEGLPWGGDIKTGGVEYIVISPNDEDKAQMITETVGHTEEIKTNNGQKDLPF